MKEKTLEAVDPVFFSNEEFDVCSQSCGSVEIMNETDLLTAVFIFWSQIVTFFQAKQPNPMGAIC